MNPKPLDLIPYCIELFKVIFENFILRAFYTKFVSRYCDLVNLKVFFLSYQNLKYQILHSIFKHMQNHLMETLN